MMPVAAMMAMLLLTGDVDAAPLTITRTDGRTLTGQLDSRTDSRQLWLRRGEAQFVLRSACDWKDIKTAHVGDDKVTIAELQLHARARATHGRSWSEIPRVEGNPETSPETVEVEQRVETLHIDAHLANWDADPFPDGLHVFVTPLDHRGKLVAVDGMLDLVLYVGRDAGGGSRRRPGEPEFHESERISQRVRKADFAPGYAMVKLPFDRDYPPDDLHVLPVGLVTARLGIAGTGVFEATAEDVCLRPISKFRDDLQLFHGRRYLPLEDYNTTPRRE